MWTPVQTAVNTLESPHDGRTPKACPPGPPISILKKGVSLPTFAPVPGNLDAPVAVRSLGAQHVGCLAELPCLHLPQRSICRRGGWPRHLQRGER